MPYFYPPPQPVQATPRAPIGNQGDPPPRRTNHALYALRGTWSEPSWPAQYGARIAPQTLTYGDQPPRKTWHSLYQVRATWPEPTWPAQSEPDSASYNVAPVIQPPTGLRDQINLVRQQWTEATWPAQYNAKVAPLTLVYGDQPPRFNPLQPVWPQPQWNAQSAPPNAAWNVPALITANPPPNPTQWQVWQAWQTTPLPAQLAQNVVQTTGDQPPRQLLGLQITVRNQWPELSWPSQSAAPNAGWNFAPAQVDNPPPLPQVPWQIWAAWNIPPPPQQLAQLQVVDNPPAPTPDVQPIGSSGGGGRIWYQGKHHKRPRLNQQIDEILELSVEQYYADLAASDLATQAAKLVKPFTEDKRAPVPAIKSIDWAALERDSTRSRRLIALWRQLESTREIDADDDDWLMLQ